MNAVEPQQSPDVASPEATDSLRPIDHARMVLTPVLLILGPGYLFLGPGTLFENAAPAAILILFAVLNGEQSYQKWASNS